MTSSALKQGPSKFVEKDSHAFLSNNLSSADLSLERNAGKIQFRLQLDRRLGRGWIISEGISPISALTCYSMLSNSARIRVAYQLVH
jgi:hypothetical protein